MSIHSVNLPGLAVSVSAPAGSGVQHWARQAEWSGGAHSHRCSRCLILGARQVDSFQEASVSPRASRPLCLHNLTWWDREYWAFVQPDSPKLELFILTRCPGLFVFTYVCLSYPIHNFWWSPFVFLGAWTYKRFSFPFGYHFLFS